MKEEKKEKMQEILVLDEGVEVDGLIEPLSACCVSMLMPFMS